MHAGLGSEAQEAESHLTGAGHISSNWGKKRVLYVNIEIVELKKSAF